ncbi:MAG: hypothetical protein DLM59_01430 [Pseudonocardiales bacterium]|nr:MAG: hypothetical protein DLM59_01430 [Pseudonocardiales bacterium]
MSALTGVAPAGVALRAARGHLRALAPALVVFAWIVLGLSGESLVGIGGQRALGALTWVLLLALLWHESPRTRAQVAVVVVFATLVEYCFAGWLGVYVYRLHNVPAFVPPGHGLVYLAALCIGRSALARSLRRPLIAFTILAGGLWALWGVTLSARPDALGAFWYLCLLGFLLWGRQPLVYVGAFLVVSTLEILGTALGTWAWSTVDPIVGWVSMGNPPSGASGGYGWFDAAGIALAPVVVRAFSRRRPS